MHGPLKQLVFHSFSMRPRREQLGQMEPHEFLRALHTDFHNACTSLHSHQQCRGAPFSPRAHQHLLLFAFLQMAILPRVRRNLSVVEMWISLMASDGEHFFTFSLAICTSEKCPFSLAPTHQAGSSCSTSSYFCPKLYVQRSSLLSLEELGGVQCSSSAQHNGAHL